MPSGLGLTFIAIGFHYDWYLRGMSPLHSIIDVIDRDNNSYYNKLLQIQFIYYKPLQSIVAHFDCKSEEKL